MVTTPRRRTPKPTALPANIEERLDRIELVRRNPADSEIIDNPFTAHIYRTPETPQASDQSLPRSVEITVIDNRNGKVAVTTTAPGRGEAIAYIQDMCFKMGLYTK